MLPRLLLLRLLLICPKTGFTLHFTTGEKVSAAQLFSQEDAEHEKSSLVKTSGTSVRTSETPQTPLPSQGLPLQSDFTTPPSSNSNIMATPKPIKGGKASRASAATPGRAPPATPSTATKRKGVRRSGRLVFSGQSAAKSLKMESGRRCSERLAARVAARTTILSFSLLLFRVLRRTRAR